MKLLITLSTSSVIIATTCTTTIIVHLNTKLFLVPLCIQIKSANGEEEKRELRRQSLDFLERYIYLIAYNTYLAQEKATGFKRTFSVWMKEV